MKTIKLPLTILTLICFVFLAGEDAHASYYKDEKTQLFRPYPKDEGRGAGNWRIRYFGPVGIGIDLVRPGMTMKIWNVEKGSPADKTGKLKNGQIIDSINGVVLKDIDPRVILGDIITEAEATDGKINLQIKGEGNVLVEIPVMGAYSDTWPVDCEKSDKIVRNLADLIAQEKEPSWGSVLFMLSTGEEKDLQVVKRWMRGIETIGGMNWEKGYKGIGLCEYYLRTGDQSVLPVIKKMTEELKGYMYNGGWSGRGQPANFEYSTGTGHVHASGMHCLTFILMARLCGVEVDEYMLSESLTQFYRFGGRGNVAYGNGPPEGGYRDNGKTSGLAVAMAVAAQLTPEGEDSVYAKARDNSAMKAFYATNWFHAAHTGGGMGEIWHHGAMALMREKRPTQYRSYHDTRRWVMDLSRRHDGSIAIEGMDDQYNRSLTDATAGRAWGTYFALTYTYPRKALQIWGAPRSQYAKNYQLPERPWGTPADDIFNSPDPIQMKGKTELTMEELLEEKVETHASLGIIFQYQDPNLSEEEIVKDIQHPEYAMRSGAMAQVVHRKLDHLILPLLKAEDPRLRHAGLLAITGMFKGPWLPGDRITEDMLDEVSRMIENSEESWWVTCYALKALRRADADRVEKHKDRLLELLQSDSSWLQMDAGVALSMIATDSDHYQEVLPALIDTMASLRIDGPSREVTFALRDAMKEADKKVQDFSFDYFKEAYGSIPDQLVDSYTGAVMRGGSGTIRRRVGSFLLNSPEGEEFVRRVPKTTLASYISGKDSDRFFYKGKIEPNPELIGTWKWAVHPTPNKPDEIEQKTKSWLESRLKSGAVEKGSGKDVLVIEENGKLTKSHYFNKYFWSGDYLVSNEAGVAVKTEIRKFEGIRCLIVEKNTFVLVNKDDDGTSEVSKDFHPGFWVYLNAEDIEGK
jgi:hypothetical protein